MEELIRWFLLRNPNFKSIKTFDETTNNKITVLRNDNLYYYITEKDNKCAIYEVLKEERKNYINTKIEIVPINKEEFFVDVTGYWKLKHEIVREQTLTYYVKDGNIELDESLVENNALSVKHKINRDEKEMIRVKTLS